MTLKTYARQFGLMPVADVDAAAVLNVLQPIWQTKGETACRLRGRPETVLDAAKAHGLRIDEKPARWRGHLDKLLPKRSKLTRDHYAAMPYAVVPEFISQQREREAIAALALEFLILTAARSGEVLCARWEEIDFAAKVWTVPAKRSPGVSIACRYPARQSKFSKGFTRQGPAIHLLRPEPRQAVVPGCHWNGFVPDEHQHNCTWLPKRLQRLGGRGDAFPA
jgi:integrase